MATETIAPSRTCRILLFLMCLTFDLVTSHGKASDERGMEGLDDDHDDSSLIVESRRPNIDTNRSKIEDPVSKLSKMFGFDAPEGEMKRDLGGRWVEGRRVRNPPEYMMELFRNVAYQDGVSRLPNPFQADVVRGMSDKGGP